MQAASTAAAWTFFQTYKFCRLTNFSDSQTRAYALHCLLTQAVCSLLTRTKTMSAAQPLVFGLLSQQTHMA